MDNDNLHWYAIKVFWNRVKALSGIFASAGVEIYTQTVVPSLVFVRSDEKFILDLRHDRYEDLYVYSDPETRIPYVIPEKDFNIFRIVTSARDEGLEYLGDDQPKYHEGDRVRVTAGMFKGAEGHVRRIKKDRRLVISIEGVCAVATSYIHPSLLEKVND